MAAALNTREVTQNMNNNRVEKIMVFHPNSQEFSDVSKYVEYMESAGAYKAGIAKIVPPPEFVARRGGYGDIKGMIIPSPMRQILTGKQGCYQVINNINLRSRTLEEFQFLAEYKYGTPSHSTNEEIEEEFWDEDKLLLDNNPIYGAGLSGSLFDKEANIWNLNGLGTLLDLIQHGYAVKVDKMTPSKLDIGMWKTYVCYHTKPEGRYSINYLHLGKPKTWYAVPPAYDLKFEQKADAIFSPRKEKCGSVLWNTMTLMSPHVLKQHKIPFDKITQEQGEFMITFPYAYHSSFDHGYNIMESTYFAFPRWSQFEKHAKGGLGDMKAMEIGLTTCEKRFHSDMFEARAVGTDSKCDLEFPGHTQYPASLQLKLKCLAEKRVITAAECVAIEALNSFSSNAVIYDEEKVKPREPPNCE